MDSDPKSRLVEPGARWRAVGYGPLLCLVVLVVEVAAGWPPHVLTLPATAAVLAAITAIQVAAARRHVRVELTPSLLRNGVETVAVADIAEVLPAADGIRTQPWESARALGELSGVPRRRTGIGLRLVGGEVVQAWAKDHQLLRSELEELRQC